MKTMKYEEPRLMIRHTTKENVITTSPNDPILTVNPDGTGLGTDEGLNYGQQ